MILIIFQKKKTNKQNGKKKTPRDNVQKTLQSIIPRVTVQIYL